MAAERLPSERAAQPQLSVVESDSSAESVRIDLITHDIVREMNHDRRERARFDAFERTHGEGLLMDISALVEERLFEEQQELEAEGLAAQFENTFGRQPIRKRLFGI